MTHPFAHERVPYQNPSRKRKRRAKREAYVPSLMLPARTGLIFSALFLAGCDLHDMYDQPRYKPLRASRFFDDESSARHLVAGTVARGGLHEDEAFYAGTKDGTLINELPLTLDRALLERGRERFRI